MSENAVPALELIDISRSYHSGDSEIRALDHLSFTLWPGEFVAIMGQSGSGKSTLMNIIGCLDRATAGSYKIFGRDIGKLDADELATLRRETFGFIFQRYNLLANETASGNVEIPAIYAGMDKAHRKSRAHELLAGLGLGERAGHKPSELSGGQQQRVAIARALMNNPPVILADEPTGALDSKSGAEVMNLLHSLHQEGRTILLITHDEKIAQNAQRIVHILDGHIVNEEIVESSSAPYSYKQPQHSQSPGISLATSLKEAVHMAMQALRVNLFRTALTLLGIIIGVGAVVTMLAVGNGSKQKVLNQISAMGTNLLLVRPGAPGIRSSGDIVTLIPDDAKAIELIANVENAVPERSGRMTVRYGNIDYATTIQATGDTFPSTRDWQVEKGQFFNIRDVSGYAPVAVLGQTVANTLFSEGTNPLGSFILIKNVPFQVIGIMNTRGASPSGADQDDVVLVPYSTGLVRLFGKTYVNTITVKVADVKAIDETQAAITRLLKSRHRTEDFSIRNMASILETATETQNTFTILLGTVAAISLLVGGIGVMNIMLVSVTERTREIGIRMATGARMRDILLQFNTEAAVVCAVGGMLGIIIGIAAGLALRLSGMAVIFSIAPALLAFTCAFVTGIVFGYLPARTAARLDPVVALASE
jgi:macrolide transport system ATP-binding/permease protein